VRLLAWLAAGALRLLAVSMRLRVIGENPFDRAEPFVAALWHNTLYVALAMCRDRDLTVAVSPSRGGRRAALLLGHLGYAMPVWGSTSRAPVAALSGMQRAARAGQRIAVLVDGGHGPAGQVRPGVLSVARASGHPIFPVGVAVWPCLRLQSSWESVIVPLPFARVIGVIGKPLRVPPEAERDQIESLRQQLEAELHAATREAEQQIRRR
jgi:lysophospholipid acyltransferase (LPLAT)-like uncharacterized protein